jgi:hypothetical protein
MELSERAGVEIECYSGWNSLIEPLVEYVEKYNENKAEDEKIVITQIKEKFGGLRFYANNITDELRDKIAEAESDSYNVCEFCGTRKNVGHTSDWIITCCKDCAKKYVEKKHFDVKWRSAKTKKVEIIKYEK